MKHGDFLCFVTRIVEKSWKNRGKFLSSENPPFQLIPRCGSVENCVPVRLPPCLTFPYPGPATAFEVRDNTSSRCFRWFSTNFPRSEAKNCILTAIVELKRLHKDKDAGPITSFDATGPSFHAVSLCGIAFRATPQLSAGVQLPKAADGTSDHTVHRRSRTPLELRLRARRVHAVRPDNRAPLR